MTTLETCDPHELDMEKVRRWKDSAPETSYVASLFKALADRTRLQMLYLISREEWCVHDLAAACGTSLSNASHHLRLLRAMRVVKSRRSGKKVLYSLDDEHVQALLSQAFMHAGHS
ncbi:MAG: ArsR/SmtB family transcription factor [Bacillota bacterium]